MSTGSAHTYRGLEKLTHILRADRIFRISRTQVQTPDKCWVAPLKPKNAHLATRVGALVHVEYERHACVPKQLAQQARYPIFFCSEARQPSFVAPIRINLYYALLPGLYAG